jgi:D-sedoheptulose 7-phosphate isomerase
MADGRLTAMIHRPAVTHPSGTLSSSYFEERLLERSRLYERFFEAEAERLACACQAMAARFLRGGRLLAFGRGAYSTDAQHVSVEFVHPVIVGKRALPALDLSVLFGPWLDAILQPDDMVMGFAPPVGDPEIRAALAQARARGAMTFALPGEEGNYAVPACAQHPFLHQETIEILYHTLWETVHVFFERHALESDSGAAEFLYPFLGNPGETPDVVGEVAASIRMKVADDAALRAQVAATQGPQLAAAAQALAERIGRGGKLVIFGNGGSATDANDWAFDCVSPPCGWRPIPAVSLSMEPAIVSALANDLGAETIFLRQLIAHGRTGDVAIAISTSGGSRNLILALEEARKRGLVTVALLGYDGGEILRRGLADIPIVVSCDYIPRIQEVQASIYHVLREAISEAAPVRAATRPGRAESACPLDGLP